MIQNDDQMRQNVELMGEMYEALAELKRRIAPLNFTNYLILAEGPVEQIRRLKREIDEYLGVVEAMAAAEAEAERESASRESNVPA